MINGYCDHKGHCNDHNTLMKGFPVLRRLEVNDNYHQSIDLAYQSHECSQGILENRDHRQGHLGQNHMFRNYLSRNLEIVC